ncbi:MAG: light-harvesting protein [Paracoccaceae bacterium]
MNNSKLWLVVNPTVGIPLFLGAVAVGSFSVHLAVVTNTTWVSDFLKGEDMGSASAALEVDEKVQTASATTLENGDRIKVTLPNGAEAWAVIESPKTTLASALTHRSD